MLFILPYIFSKPILNKLYMCLFSFLTCFIMLVELFLTCLYI